MHRMCCCGDDIAAYIHYGPAAIPSDLTGDVPIIEHYKEPCSPFCLQNEDVIHPEVNAKKYFIDNEFVNEDTGKVRVGLEVFVQPVTRLYCVKDFEECNTDCINDNDVGACCFCNEEVSSPNYCIETNENDCNDQGGEFRGKDTLCDDLIETGELDPFEQPILSPRCEVFCDINLSCEDDPCQEQCEPEKQGACCVGDACRNRTEEECSAIGGEFKGEDNLCDPFTCLCVEEDPCVNATLGQPCSEAYVDAYANYVNSGCSDGDGIPLPCFGRSVMSYDPVARQYSVIPGFEHCVNCSGQCCIRLEAEYSEIPTYECTESSIGACAELDREFYLAYQNDPDPPYTRSAAKPGAVGSTCNQASWPGDNSQYCECYGIANCSSAGYAEWLSQGNLPIPCTKPPQYSCCGAFIPTIPDWCFPDNCQCISFDQDPTETDVGSCCINGKCHDGIKRECCSQYGGVFSEDPCNLREFEPDVCGPPLPADEIGSCCRNGSCEDGVLLSDCVGLEDLIGADGTPLEEGGPPCERTEVFNLGSENTLVDISDVKIWSRKSCDCRAKNVLYPEPLCPREEGVLPCQSAFPRFGISLTDVGDPLDLLTNFQAKYDNVDFDELSPDDLVTAVEDFRIEREDICCEYNAYDGADSEGDELPEGNAGTLVNGLCSQTGLHFLQLSGEFDPPTDGLRVCNFASDSPCQSGVSSTGQAPLPQTNVPVSNIAGSLCAEFQVCGFTADPNRPCLEDDDEDCPCKKCVAHCFNNNFENGEPTGPIGFSHCEELDGRLHEMSGLKNIREYADITDSPGNGTSPIDPPHACPPPPPQCFDLRFEHVFTTNDKKCIEGIPEGEDSLVDLPPVCTEEDDCYSEPFVDWKPRDPAVAGNDAWEYWGGETADRGDGITNYLFEKIVERFGPQRLPTGRINPYPKKIYFTFDPAYKIKSASIGGGVVPHSPAIYVLRNLYERIEAEYDTIEVKDPETGEISIEKVDPEDSVAYLKFEPWVSSLSAGRIPYQYEEGPQFPQDCSDDRDANFGQMWGLYDIYYEQYPTCRAYDQFKLARAAFSDATGLGAFDYMTAQIELADYHFRVQQGIEHCVADRSYPEAGVTADPIQCEESICNPYAGFTYDLRL